MTFLAIVLVSLSAFLHAGWNLFSKSQHPTTAFFFIATVTGSLLLTPAAFLYWETVQHFSTSVWILLTLSGFFLALYFCSLAGAYRAGDLSVAYPLARAAPVLLVSLVTWLLGLGQQMSEMAFIGTLFVVVGCFLIPLQRFSDFHFRNYWNANCGLALLAAIGTSGYSILDDEALKLLRANADISVGDSQATLVYACFEGLASVVWLALFVALRQRGRESLRQVLRGNLRQAVLTGVAIYLTYTIILLSLAFVDNVSYVVGFRQLSIPLGTTFGILALKESPHRPKIFGILVMFTGLVLLALG